MRARIQAVVDTDWDAAWTGHQSTPPLEARAVYAAGGRPMLFLCVGVAASDLDQQLIGMGELGAEWLGVLLLLERLQQAIQ